MYKFLSFIILFTVFQYGNINGQTGLSIDTVVSVNNTGSQLNAKTKLWVAQTFNDYKAVLQVDDPANGILIIKGIANYLHNHYSIKKKDLKLDSEQWSDKASFTLKILTKDQKFKISITDIVLLDPSGIDALSTSLTTELINGNSADISSPDLKTRCRAQNNEAKYNAVMSWAKNLESELVAYLCGKSETDF